MQVHLQCQTQINLFHIPLTLFASDDPAQYLDLILSISMCSNNKTTIQLHFKIMKRKRIEKSEKSNKLFWCI